MPRAPLAVTVVASLAAVGAALPALAAGAAQQRTWHADQATVPGAQSAGRSGAGVTVAVLDSWVDRDHPDFEGRVLQGADCTGGACRTGQGTDACDHGTHVAGTVAASSYGVAPDARILPVRVLTYDEASGDCTGRPTDVAAGIRWAVSRGAQVLNLSLGPDVPGLSSSSAIPTAVREAADAGVVVIFSAGNTGAPVTDSYGDTALIVAATGRSGGLASYSQRGAGVDLAAPGGDPEDEDACTQADCITSLYPGNRYAVAAGTSMAAPHVAGVAALLIAQQPSRTRQQVVARMTSTARPLADAGSGRVDATAALGAKRATATPSPRPATTTKAPVPVVRGNSRPPRTPASASTTRPPAASTAPTPPASGTTPPVVPPSAPATDAPAPSVASPLVLTGDEVPLGVAVLAGGLLVGAATSLALVSVRGRVRSSA